MVPPAASPCGDTVSPQRLLRDFPQLARAPVLLVAYSGGLDSTVLLHLLVQARTAGLLQGELRAVHVHHGLQDQADSWLQHCQQVCAGFELALEVCRLTLNQGHVSEGNARIQRYACFEALLPAGGVLLQAHHQQDQVETLLFRLLRGTGIKGMGGIPALRPCGAGSIVRPLLKVPLQSLRDHAAENALVWVEDPTNAQGLYSRNFLRQTILPELYQRWPALGGRMEMTADHCREAVDLLEELAREDLERLVNPRNQSLAIEALQQLSVSRRNNVLRHWYQWCVDAAAMPLDHTSLRTMQTTIIEAAPDASPVMQLGLGEAQREVRRYRNHLYLVSRLPALPASLAWQPGTVLDLPASLGSLSLVPAEAGNALAFRPDEPLEVRFRQGGERVRIAGRPTRCLKKLLQESGVPPWLRDRIPLIFQHEELLAIGDLYQCETNLPRPAGQALKVMWKHPDLHCGS